MEIHDKVVLTDGPDLVSKVSSYDKDVEIVPVEINLPDYLDVTTLIALQKRFVELTQVTKRKVRLVSKTTNNVVEKTVHRLFSDSDNIFVTIEWRDN